MYLVAGRGPVEFRENGDSYRYIVTSAFEELVRTTMKEQGVSDMAIVVVEHPIAGRSMEDIRKVANGAFSDILKVATQWQPGR
jgi:hypothetical protein